jgi:N-acetylmuramoyl-L-alanine amidase
MDIESDTSQNREPMPAPRRWLLRSLAASVLAGAVLGLLPPAAGASAPPTVMRTVPLDEGRLLPPTAAAARTPAGGVQVGRPGWSPDTVACAPIRFTMVGVVWRQSGNAVVPTRVAWGRPGGFGRTTPVVADPDEGPDPGSPDDAGLAGTPLVWTGEARCARFRLRFPAGQSIRDVRAVFLNTSGTAERPSLLDRAGDALARAWGMVAEPLAPDAAEASPTQPAIITRQQWGASEKLRRCGPYYAEDGLKMAYVHHTVNSNAYPASRADDLIRGIYAYHVRGRHYCDIAYNFLIDRFGRIFEGRYGGMDQPVVGGHAMGFNTGSTGIAALGTFSTVSPPRAMVNAYRRLLAWRLDVAHLRPTGKAVMESGGGPAQKFKKGQVVTLPVIAGHRDTGFTTCPGTLYKRLGSIRRSAEVLGLPKIWNPQATPEAVSLWQGQTVRFQATLSQAMSWTLDIVWTDPATGATQTVRQYSGTGPVIDVTWDARGSDGITAAPIGPYAVTFRAQAGGQIAREATVPVTVNP